MCRRRSRPERDRRVEQRRDALAPQRPVRVHLRHGQLLRRLRRERLEDRAELQAQGRAAVCDARVHVRPDCAVAVRQDREAARVHRDDMAVRRARPEVRVPLPADGAVFLRLVLEDARPKEGAAPQLGVHQPLEQQHVHSVALLRGERAVDVGGPVARRVRELELRIRAEPDRTPVQRELDAVRQQLQRVHAGSVAPHHHVLIVAELRDAAQQLRGQGALQELEVVHEHVRAVGAIQHRAVRTGRSRGPALAHARRRDLEAVLRRL